ncbi:hypothetical protein [Guptibacillus hwajinpoensis]|uniref:Phr family secreted Rap phosphatase inhibitor n=1 Tax=Guptibacillus hwajinpoensis TaxID=208199 RepID=A0ABU0K2Z5_9BACL|nr:hypothetical protein [Alkalihalobacillus hemicentroti]MDQ0482679.1 hypothetical protein [Alkalihalobacillus hemicentroti]
MKKFLVNMLLVTGVVGMVIVPNHDKVPDSHDKVPDSSPAHTEVHI